MATILVEQYIDFAFGLADQIAVLDRGRIRMAGHAAELDRAEIRRAVAV